MCFAPGINTGTYGANIKPSYKIRVTAVTREDIRRFFLLADHSSEPSPLFKGEGSKF